MRISDWSSDVCSSDLTAEDAVVSLDFDALDGGFLLPGEADPVWAGDIDRMFVSLVPPDYDLTEAALAAPVEGWAEMSAITCTGSGSVLAIGDAMLPEHGLGIANGYDDSYHLTRSEEHTSELQSLMRNSYAVFCLKKKKKAQQRV